MDKTRAFIYAIGDLAYLGYDPYFTAPGAGLRLLSFATERSVLDAGLRRAGASSTTRPIFCSTRSATEHRQGLARPIPTT
jgi:hypothetical protein